MFLKKEAYAHKKFFYDKLNIPYGRNPWRRFASVHLPWVTEKIRNARLEGLS